MTGFFFCLASTRCRAFILPGGVSATHKRSQQIFCYQCNYTAKTSKAFTGLCMGVSVNLTHPSAHNTADTQTAYAPPAPHWRAYRQALHLHRYKIPPPRRTLYRAGQPPIIICIGMGAPVRIVMDPCQAAHLLRGQRLHLYRVSPAACNLAPGQKSVARRQAARNHWRLPPLIFSGFRPITNKGEQ